MKQYRYYLLMVIATFFFAGAFVAGKLGSSNFSPVVLTFLRMGMASLILFPFMVYKEGISISKNGLILSFVLGLIGMTFYHMLFFTALKYTTASNASVINGTMPMITAFISIWLIKERISKKQVIFMITAFIGVITILINWDIKQLLAFDFNKGDIIMMFGTISWATYSVLIKKYNKDLSALKLTSYTLLMCTMIVMPFAMYEIIMHDALNVAANNYYTIIYMAIFPTVIGYTIQQASIKAIGPSTAALFINLVPFFSIILSVIILRESIYPLNLLSGLIIIISVILFTKNKALN